MWLDRKTVVYHVVSNHVKVVAFGSQNLLPVTNVLAVKPAVKALANGSGDYLGGIIVQRAIK